MESLLAEIAKLEQLRALALLSNLLRGLHPDQAKRFRRRAAVESAWELRRHPERIRLPLLAFRCPPREAEVVDGLVELLIQVTHRITVKAGRRVADKGNAMLYVTDPPDIFGFCIINGPRDGRPRRL